MSSPHRGFYRQRSFADLMEVLILGDANSCCRVLTGLVVVRMPLLLRIFVSGSVTPLMHGKTAKPSWESGGSVHLFVKNIPTNSSGEGMTSEVDFFFKMYDMVADG